MQQILGFWAFMVCSCQKSRRIASIPALAAPCRKTTFGATEIQDDGSVGTNTAVAI